MWGSLLVLGLLVTIDPLRLGVILLLISRPRPIHSLFAYWAGCALASIFNLLIPLTLLHVVPTFHFLTEFSDGPTSSTVRQVLIGLGVTALLAAALMGVLFATRQEEGRRGRHAAQPATRRGDASTLVLDSYAPASISRLLSPTEDAAKEGTSAFRRLLRRIRNAWHNGSVWVAFVIGTAMGPAIQGVVLVLAIIVASGASFAVQSSAAIMFVVAMLFVEETILVSNMITPVKTQAFLRRLHDWAMRHKRKIVVAIAALVGISLIAQGIAAG